MPNDTLAGFITKKQAAERYRRSHRQLTRDITEAIKAGKTKYLANFKLRTEDDTDGPDVTIEMIGRLRGDGKNPMWLVDESWMRETYGAQDADGKAPTESPQTDPERPQSKPEPKPEEGSRRTVDSEYVQLLRDQNEELKRDKDRSNRSLARRQSAWQLRQRR